MRPLIPLLCGIVALAFAGCSTLASYESISFESDPPGAEVVVQCGATRLTTVTPGRVLLPRKAPSCLVTIGKEGFVEERRWLRSSVEESMWVDTLALAAVGGGVLITSSTGGGIEGEIAGEFRVMGLVPWIVNLATCNFCDHEPPEMRVALRPLPARASK